jgi:glucose-1-phosphate cytidylyltransferase
MAGAGRSELPPVVILCGGLGTRLREETEWRPKPLVEVGGRPILWHIMRLYAHHGVRDFVLALGYKGGMIKEYFLNFGCMQSDYTLTLGEDGVKLHGDYPERGWRITFADTGTDAHTGCRLFRLKRYVDAPHFFMTYGDGLANVDLPAQLRFHRDHGRVATITGVRPLSRFGEIVADGERVVDFREKPQVREGFINGGFFVFSRGIFDYVDGDEGCALEGEPMERLVREGQLRLWRHEAPWYCMDTYRDWLLLSDVWKSGRAEWKVWE